ncbi:MAG: D-TA family PLP-dependent enzyme [Treponema sp.]|nr:D-TA family PLP-dependent enzyme [Treponema sp.]
MNYHFDGEEEIPSPALVFYRDQIERNTDGVIALAGNPERLWPHVKTHKTREILLMQMEKGISRFKCATIAEAELCARTGAPHVMMAYPLVGPALGRFAALRQNYPQTCFWAIGDDLGQLQLLSQALAKTPGDPLPLCIDVNMGMDRTGVALDSLAEFYTQARTIPGLRVRGFHCYDGHLGIENQDERRRALSSPLEKLLSIIEDLKKEDLKNAGEEEPLLIMGGSPSFPLHAEHRGVYLSPGTLFVNDYNYSRKFKDLDFPPAAAVLSRVISHPTGKTFTLDAGHKALGADSPLPTRGFLPSLPQAIPILHSEEHWVWQLDQGPLPPLGTVVYIIPGHICPTVALYPQALVVSEAPGRQIEYWDIAARNRRIEV